MSRISYIAFSKSSDIDAADFLRAVEVEFETTLLEVSGKGANEIFRAIYSKAEQFPLLFCNWINQLDQLADLRTSYAGNLLHVHVCNGPDNSTLFRNADLILCMPRLTVSDAITKIRSRIEVLKANDAPLVDIIIGGQYGSEGKGQIAAYLSHEYDLLIRVGGPNAGHKVFEVPTPYTFHLLPSGSRTNPKATIIIGPGAVLSESIIMKEIGDLDKARRIFIDPQCMVISEDDRQAEAALVAGIGSTGQGVGSATSRRIMGRGTGVRLAKDVAAFKPFLKPTIDVLTEAYSGGKKILLEGTQGTGLSLFHGDYPYVTSRDTTASGCLSEAGISPKMVRKIIMVCRTYPIRVQSPKDGTSGPMGMDTNWGEISSRSKIPLVELEAKEKTSTTKRDRRVAEFNWELLRKAAALNLPTDIALTFADYVSIENRSAMRIEQLSPETLNLIHEIELVARAEVSMIATDFSFRSIIDRRKWG